jgi:hypothetical protein
MEAIAMSEDRKLGPIRRGSVVTVDIPEDAPEHEIWEGPVPDGCTATVLMIEKDGMAHLWVGDDWGPCDEVVPVKYLIHESEPFDAYGRMVLLWRFEKVHEHEAERPPDIEHLDGFTFVERFFCKHCSAILDIHHVAVETDEPMVCIEAHHGRLAAKRCQAMGMIRHSMNFGGD